MAVIHYFKGIALILTEELAVIHFLSNSFRNSVFITKKVKGTEVSESLIISIEESQPFFSNGKWKKDLFQCSFSVQLVKNYRPKITYLSQFALSCVLDTLFLCSVRQQAWLCS